MADAVVTSGARVEWRTVAVAAAVHSGWLLVVAYHDWVPWPVAVAALGVIGAWHGSLQHETIHGHPFASRRLNGLIASLPLALMPPYRVYRRYHEMHHQCPDLTDPVTDTESFYVSAERWKQIGPVGRAFITANHTLLGRMVLGPPLVIVRLLLHQAGEIRRGDRELARWWSGHVVAVALLLVFVTWVTGMALWIYLLGGGYVAQSLTLLRSYCEHRFSDGDETRSAIVVSGRVFGMLYLNNNLHHVHHAEPGVPWYRLHQRAAETGAYATAAAGAGLYRGYFEVARRFLFRPFDHPVHPEDRASLAS